MTFVQVAHLGMQAKLSKQSPATDAQNDLLLQPHFGIATIELTGDAAMRRGIGKIISIEQLQLISATIRLPTPQPYLRSRKLNLQPQPLSVFQSMRPLTSDDVVRGQYVGYRRETDVARNSDVETFAAIRLFIDSWRWEGVPWYLRSGKYLPVTETEVLVELKPPPQKLFADSAPADGPGNYLRFRISPDSDIALAARVKLAGSSFVGIQKELRLLEQQPGAETPYERLLGER